MSAGRDRGARYLAAATDPPLRPEAGGLTPWVLSFPLVRANAEGCVALILPERRDA